jgi:hypothetical protein
MTYKHTYTDDEVWTWYSHCENMKKEELGAMRYARKHNLEYKKLVNMRYRIVFQRESNPESYNKLMKDAKDFKASGLSKSVFCSESGVSKFSIDDAMRHLSWLERIERLSKDRVVLPNPEPVQKPKEEAKLTFKALATGISEESKQLWSKSLPIKAGGSHVPDFPPPQEVLEKQNDIEITITKGVKVCIAPGIDSMKIIKIIELLKDL